MAFRVTLAGEVGVEAEPGSEHAGGAVGAGGLGRLGRVALAYLVTERHRPVPRGELADALWGEDLPQSWETSLRVVASRLRTWLSAAGLDGPRALTSAFGCYQLHLPAATVVDVEEAAEALEAARRAWARGQTDEARSHAIAAASVASREFLPGGSGSWVERRQAELRELRLGALEAVADASLASGEPAAALAAAEEVLVLDPLRESAYLRVMGAHAESGNRGAALRAYERCRQVLAEELGVFPSAATEAAYLSLLGEEGPAPSPAARSSDQAPSSPGPRTPLPSPLSSFVGRETEVAEVAALTRSGGRLVTLLGTGGVGKTRLALEVGAVLAAEFADGAVLLPLADVAEPAGVPRQALAVLGLIEELGTLAVDTVAAAIRDNHLLLILDNCEHVIAAAAELVAALLRSAPSLTVLATSREPLGVPGEVVWRVPSLAPADAVRLFVERASAARPGSEPTSAQEEEAVAMACRRLDGIPLAVELAAARSAVLTVAEIAERLDDRFRLLSGGPRTAPPRHQTLRAAIDWTYDALPPAERVVLNRLAVFGGSFTLAAADRVAGDGVPGDVFEVLTSLVNRSLVLAERTASATTRYRLMESIRSYAVEKLDASGEADAIRSRLLGWAVELAETAEGHLDGPDQARWLSTLDAEHPNLRAALAGPRGAPHTAMPSAQGAARALALAVALARFWEVRGHFEEGRRELRRLLDEAGDEASPLLLARAQNLAGVLAQRQGDYAAARSRYEASLAIRRRMGDKLGMAIAVHGLGNLAALERSMDEARALYEESLAIGRDLGDPALTAAALANLGWVAHTTGDFPAAAGYYEEALAVRRGLGDKHGIGLLLGHLGDLAYQQGDYSGAAALHAESLSLRTELGDRAGRADSLSTLGHLALQSGDRAAAQAQLHESLALRRELGDKAALPAALANLADLALLGGEMDEARRYLAEAEQAAVMGRDKPALAHVLLHSARLARMEGRLPEAAEHYVEARRAAGRLGLEPLTAEWLEGVGAIAAAQGDARTGARLLGAAEAVRRSLGAPVPPHEQTLHDTDVDTAGAALGTEALSEAWEAGRGLPLDQAIGEALAALG